MSKYSPKYIKTSFMVLFLSAATVFNLSAQTSLRNVEQTSSQILDLHISQAQEAQRLGYQELAWQILQRADEFYDAYNPDYLNLKAQLLFHRGFLRQAKSILETLLADKTLAVESEGILYELYLRNHNYDKIVDLFSIGLLRDSNAFFYHQLALYYLQDDNLFAFSQSSMRRFNHDVRFLLPWLVSSRDSQQQSLLSRLSLLHDIVRKDSDNLILLNMTDQEILIGLIRQLPQELAAEVMPYLEPWLRDNINYQLLQRQRIITLNAARELAALEDPEQPLELIEYQEPVWRELVGKYVLVDYLHSLEDVALVESKLPWAQDSMMDGFANLIGTVNAHGDGEILYTPYQDDLVGQRVHYRKFMIEQLEQSDRMVSVRVEFASFPMVGQAVVSANRRLNYDDQARDFIDFRYWLLFDAFSVPLNEQLFSIGESIGLQEVVFDAQASLLNTDFFSMSSHIDELHGERLFRRIRRLNAREVQVWQDSQLSGNLDHFMYVKDGNILYARRTLGAGDEHLILEIYENNDVVGVAFGVDNENFDFYEELTGEYTFQIWDFDSDGYINVYRKVQQAPLQPRERRVWLTTPVAVDKMLLHSFEEAKRWLREIN